MGGKDGMDIRLPMGLMFFIIGIVLSIYGASTRGDPMYAATSLGLNMNLRWGLVLLLFGGTMLALAWNAARNKPR